MPDETPLLRDFALIMAVAAAGLLLFQRLKQPPILGYLLTGVITGPHVLPILAVEETKSIHMLADLGLVLLLFGLGLEFGWQRIRQVGLQVMLIGAIEMSLLIALGFEVGVLLGWSGTEAVFVGAALSISSSAVLVKVLRDTGKLRTIRGRLMVGILVVEDFVAVVLLSVLSGIGPAQTEGIRDVGVLAGKLALFAAAALVLGALLASRLVDFAARFRSREMLLITSLGLCFGMAIIAQVLGISAAAGAFLIGAVLGDSKQGREIDALMSPVRDVFAALFFVSIGMLVDVSLFKSFLVPALVLSAVFILGKMLANTVATYLVGHDEKTSVSVGMGMPQMGEFSLAMVKVGTSNGVVGAFLYPVITVTMAITSFLYPFLFQSSDRVADSLERHTPRLLKQYLGSLSSWLIMLRNAFGLKSEAALRCQSAGKMILLNLGIIMLLIATGTVLLRFTDEIAAHFSLQESASGLMIGAAVIVLCIPSGVAAWKGLLELTDGLTLLALRGRPRWASVWEGSNLRRVLRDSILLVVVVLLLVWSLPLVSHLLSLGKLAAPVPIFVLVVLVFLFVRTAFRIHGELEETFQRTFLGQGSPGSEEESEDEDGHH